MFVSVASLYLLPVNTYTNALSHHLEHIYMYIHYWSKAWYQSLFCSPTLHLFDQLNERLTWCDHITISTSWQTALTNRITHSAVLSLRSKVSRCEPRLTPCREALVSFSDASVWQRETRPWWMWESQRRWHEFSRSLRQKRVIYDCGSSAIYYLLYYLLRPVSSF